MKEKARKRDNPRNIAQTSGYGKDRTAFTFLAGDPFFQLQAVALVFLRVVRLAASFLSRSGVVVGTAEAGYMGAGAEPSGMVADALLRAISWLTRQRQLSEMLSPVRFFRRKA